MSIDIFCLYTAISGNSSFPDIYYLNDTMCVVIKSERRKSMFTNNRYLTCGVDSTIPPEIQLFLWECVDRLPEPKDYLQVFELKPVGSLQSITHSSEEPNYRMEYLLPLDTPIAEKVYIIDDGDHSTMLLASEY